ncbi:MAG: baseplate J/gp47 family protein [Anaerolineae bacterium]|jgi:hypothetical protein|nr:baseplate J/gp47 family protein [Anaerolineae bacterium]
MAMTEISLLYINPDDDRAAVEALIRKSEGAKLLLIFAGHTASDIDIVDLQLLHRMAQRSEKQMAIATRNAKLIDAAEYLGIPHFRTPAQARREEWAQTVPEGNKVQAHTRIDGRKQPARYQPSKHTRQWWEWVFLGLIVMLVTVIGLLFFSRATITVEPNRESQSLSLELTASSAVRAANLSGDIPLRSSAIILEATNSAEATGVLSFPEGYAEGILTITNITGEALSIPAGLTVQTVEVQPVQFITNEAVALEPAGENGDAVKVGITAKVPGRDGNVTVGEILAVVGEYGSSVAVNNAGATFGGYNRFVDTPTESDIEALRETLLADLLSQAVAEYTEQMNAEGFAFLPESILVDEILSEEVVPMPGEPADEFHMTIRVSFSAKYIDPADLEQISQQLLDASLPEGYVADEDEVHFSPVNEPVANEDGSYQWRVLLHRKMVPDLTRLNLNSFAGQTRNSLLNWISVTYPMVETTQITIKPTFWWWLPIFPQRMEIIIL